MLNFIVQITNALVSQDPLTEHQSPLDSILRAALVAVSLVPTKTWSPQSPQTTLPGLMHYIALGAKHGNFQLDYVTPGSLALCGDIQAQTDFNKIY